MPDKALPPVPFASNSVGVAFVYANNQGFIFYYDQTDRKLSMAKGKEHAGYNRNAIAIGQKPDYVTFNMEPTPTPLAAGYNPDTKAKSTFLPPLPRTNARGPSADILVEKEIRVYYVENNKTIGELITTDFGNTWEYGSLTKAPFTTGLPGGLTAYAGDIWRVIIRMQGQPETFVELYEQAPKTWASYIIP